MELIGEPESSFTLCHPPHPCHLYPSVSSPGQRKSPQVQSQPVLSAVFLQMNPGRKTEKRLAQKSSVVSKPHPLLNHSLDSRVYPDNHLKRPEAGKSKPSLQEAIPSPWFSTGKYLPDSSLPPPSSYPPVSLIPIKSIGYHIEGSNRNSGGTKILISDKPIFP